MPPKRPSTGPPPSGSPTGSKHPKTDHFGPEDFSNSVKRKLAASTRTGQACDRCKIRKIRCDGLPGGCSPCLQNNTECRTTDRITGRATSRGYVEELEQRNRDLENRLRDYEARLISMGVDVKANGYHDPGLASMLDWTSTGSNGHTQMWGPPPQHGPAPQAIMSSFPSQSPGASVSPRTQEANIFRTSLPVFRTQSHGDNYVGVSSGNSYLSSIKGTSLSVLGMEIDVADFSSSDIDEPSSLFQPEFYNKSYQSFLQSAYNVNPKIEKVDLPPKDEGLTYASWYFRVINPYIPILHRPTFMALLTRMYDDPDFRPTPAEIVMVHMVFAIMFFQYAARNEKADQQTELNARSNLFYHYSLGFYYQLVASHTLQDIQALTLICAHLRNFPKPGASWMVTNSTFTLAIELGLHRSTKRWVQQGSQRNPLEIELRKRVFWTILSIHVTLSGKLGRPMPMRLNDFDVELPEAIDDELLSENGVDTTKPGKCTHKIGIEAFKAVTLFMEMFTSIYAVKRAPTTYIEVVNRLENKLKEWRAQWPPELAHGSPESDQEDRVFSLYLQLWVGEFRLLLRHPSVSMTMSAEFNNESLDICLESARSMLQTLKLLRRYKSFDTTWYNSAVYLMAITTALYANWFRRNELSGADIACLRDEMDQWTDIMGEIGSPLGSGNRLKEAVRHVADTTIATISRDRMQMQATAAASQDVGPNRSGSRSPGRGPSNSGNFYGHNFSTPFGDTGGPNGSMNGAGTATDYLSPESGLGGAQAPYPTAPQYTYPEPSVTSAMSYSTDANVFANPAYPAPDGSLPTNPLNNREAPSQPSFNIFAQPATTNAAYHATTAPWNPNPGSQSWRQWTGTMAGGSIAGNLDTQDSYSTVSALMQLGGRDLPTAADGGAGAHAPVADMGAPTTNPVRGSIGSAEVSRQQPWPLTIFDSGQGGPTGQQP